MGRKAEEERRSREMRDGKEWQQWKEGREMVEKKILIIMIWVKEMGWEGGVCFIIIKSR